MFCLKSAIRFSTNTPRKSYLSSLPDRWQPYIKLGRYEKPIGYLLLYWPCAWGLSLVAPLPTFFDYGLFLLGSVTMRAAGCIANDWADKDFDNQVERTKQRPLATRQLTGKQAIKLLIPNLACGLFVLSQLNISGIIASFAIVPIVCIYPLMKRYTNYPQFVLGVAFNWGVVVAYLSRAGSVDPHVVIPMYLAGICWTLVYDTIYAYQDIKDDERIGVKSTAITWKQNYNQIFDRLIAGSCALMIYSGISAQFSSVFPALVILSHLAWRARISRTDISNRAQCGKVFKQSSYFGLAITLSLIIGNLFRRRKQQRQRKKQL